MSDHDRLERFARETTQQVLAPDFDSLVTTSRRRRRTSLLMTGVAAAAVVGVVAVGVQAVGDDQGAPVHPAPSVQTPQPTTPHPGPGQATTAQGIVHGSPSYLYRLAVSGDDPEVRAAIWGHGRQEALTVTADGFVTAHYLLVAPLTDLMWAGGDSFLLRLRSGQLVSMSAQGEIRDITFSSQVSPMRATETLFTTFLPSSGEPQYVAVDPRAATSHPIPVPYPSGRYVQLTQGEGQTIWGTMNSSQFARPRLVSSADGGATWRSPVLAQGSQQLDPIDSAAPDTLAVIAAGDDDFKIGQDLRRSTDGGQTWHAVHPTALHGTNPGWLAVQADGRLLVWVFTTFGGATLDPGLYESDSTSWQSFHRVTVTSQDGPAGVLRLTLLDASGRQSLYVQGRAGLLASTDGGRTWTTTRAR